MNVLEAIKARHSVRSYSSKAIEGEVLEQMCQMVEECNRGERGHSALFKRAHGL